MGRKLNTSRTGGNETIDNIDNNSKNDDINNLQLLTYSENASKHRGELRYNSKFIEKDIINIRNMYYKDLIPLYKIAQFYNSNIHTIFDIINFVNWNYISYEIPKNYIKPKRNIEYCGNSKLTEKDIMNILKLFHISNYKQFEIINLFYPHVNKFTISDLIRGKTWLYLQTYTNLLYNNIIYKTKCGNMMNIKEVYEPNRLK